MSEPVAWLNGQLVPQSQAVVSVIDTGFVQGVTVAEQLRTFLGRIYRIDEHLERLAVSLRLLEIDLGFELHSLASAAEAVVRHNYPLVPAGGDLGVSVFVTPGSYPAYSWPAGFGPTACIHTYPLPFALWAAKYRIGQPLVTTQVQQVPVACWPRELKCRSRMHYYLADREATRVERGARALLVDQAGAITEASTANVLLYQDNAGLVSPPLEKVLPGISLATLAELAAELKLPLSYRDIKPDEVRAADEVLLSSTPFCLLPVNRVDGQVIGSGGPGPIFRKLTDAWSRRVGLDIIQQAEQFLTPIV